MFLNTVRSHDGGRSENDISYDLQPGHDDLFHGLD